jgi:phosphopantothenoylcysteine decarboxylase/phosphopantothenate--cysteine ligase
MRIIIGITGGISAYRIPDLAGALLKNGHEIKVVMTENAKKFITPLTMATLARGPVYEDSSEWASDGIIKHIDLAKWIGTPNSGDMLAVVPATANTLVKMARGIADNLLTSLYLALRPDTHVILFPAMNSRMWESVQTQSALSVFRDRPNHKIVPPEEGFLACGDYGVGKLPSIRKIVESIEEELEPVFTKKAFPKDVAK